MADFKTEDAKSARKVKPAAAAVPVVTGKLGAVPKAAAAKPRVAKTNTETPEILLASGPQPEGQQLERFTPPVIEPIATVTSPADSVAEPKKDVNMNETINTIENTATQTGEKATEMFRDMQDKTKAAFEKSGDVMKDVVEFHKANLEAVVESGKVAAKGTQTAMQNAVDYSKKNWEATTTHAKALSGVRAPADFVKMQSDFARSQFDGMVAEFTKSSEFTMKMMGEMMQPIQNRAAAVAEQMKTRMAA